MFKTLFNLIFNRDEFKQKEKLLENKDIVVILPLEDNKPYTGYLSIWSIKTYTIVVKNSIVSTFKNIRVGNIFKSFASIPKTFVYSLHQVNYNLENYRMNMLDAYHILVEK